MAKLTRKDKREQTEKADKELKQYILSEAKVRGDFHRCLKRWLELKRIHALHVDGLSESDLTNSRDW
jgi:hypothetical protein